MQTACHGDGLVPPRVNHSMLAESGVRSRLLHSEGLHLRSSSWIPYVHVRAA